MPVFHLNYFTWISKQCRYFTWTFVRILTWKLTQKFTIHRKCYPEFWSKILLFHPQHTRNIFRGIPNSLKMLEFPPNFRPNVNPKLDSNFNNSPEMLSQILALKCVISPGKHNKKFSDEIMYLQVDCWYYTQHFLEFNSKVCFFKVCYGI